MLLKTYNTNYNLIEFDLFVNEIDGECVSVIEMLIDCSVEDFEKNGLGNDFFIETERLTYVFSGFEINEFYEEKGYVKVVCVK